MRLLRSAAPRTASLVAWLATGCISDHALENDVPASPGIVQPDGSSGAKLAAAEACQRIKTARASAATKLGCDDRGDQCPGFLFIAGSMPCAEYTEGSVDACVAVIAGYASCKDFSEKACVVTPVGASCTKPAAPEGGSKRHDSGGSADAAASGG